MKKLILAVSMLFAFGYLAAQDEAIYTHYHLNPTLVNPGATGFKGHSTVHMNARLQWTGFPGSPESYALSYNGAVGESFGLGAMIFNEEIASLSRTRIQLNYAFLFNKFENYKIGLGLSTEFERHSVPSSVLTNPLYDEGDALLIETTDGRSFFDASLGLWGTFKENTFFGISFPNLISQTIDDIGNTGAAGDQTSTLFRYYMVNLGHAFKVSDMDFVLEPSIMLRKVRHAPFQLDFNVKAKFLDERIITGLQYRSGTGGAIGLLLGTKINELKLYYSYDIAFQRFQRYNSGSHEITLSFEFGQKDKDRAAKFR